MYDDKYNKELDQSGRLKTFRCVFDTSLECTNTLGRTESTFHPYFCSDCPTMTIKDKKEEKVMKDTLVVNLLGGSGCGKSTSACRIFAWLKDQGMDVELVTEYVKDMVWEGRTRVFTCQPYIFGKQLYKIVRVAGQVDVIITDRPIFLDVVYGEEEGEHFQKYVLEQMEKFNNLNILLNRVKPFNPNGRNEKSIEEAKAWDTKVRYWLDKTNTPYVEIDGSPEGCKQIYDAIISRLVLNKVYESQGGDN